MRVALLLLALALQGCASTPCERASWPDEPAVVSVDSEGHVAGVLLPDRSSFVTRDGGAHWSRGYGLMASSCETDAPQSSCRVTRDFDSDPAALPRWRVWQREGISWRLLATLPDDVGVGE